MRRSQTRSDPLAELQTEGAGPSRSPMDGETLLDTCLEEYNDNMHRRLDKPRRISPLATNSPISASRSPRSPLKESRQGNRIPFPSPVSNSPTTSRHSGAYPPAFADSPYQRYVRETSLERSAPSPLETLKKAADYVNSLSFGTALHSPLSQGTLSTGHSGRSTSPVSSASSSLTFDDFASIVAGSERSPVLGGKLVLPPTEDDSPMPDETSREAAAILMSVAEDAESLAPRRTERTSRPTGKAASTPPKVSRLEGKKAKTAATPSTKVQGEPAPKKQKKASFRLKDPVEGAIDGVGMAPQAFTYKVMIYMALKELGRPVRYHEVFECWKRWWPFYANMTEPDHLKSVDNSIRHTMSLRGSKKLFQLLPDDEYPELVAAEKAMGINNTGEWWSIIPGRTLENHSKLPAQERKPKVTKKKQN